MENYDKIIKAVDSNLIYCLIPMILTLILIELVFQKRFPTKKVLRFISWTILGYTSITLIHFVYETIFNPDISAFFLRATGRYKITYWTMFLSATVLPLSLLIKNLKSKFWYVLLVAFFMKIGVYFESLVILTTSFNREYASGNGFYMWLYGISMTMLQGFLLVIITLRILKIIEQKKTVHNN